MTQIQEQKLNQYFALRDFLRDNPVLLEQNKHLFSWYRLFLNNLDSLTKLINAMEENYKIISDYPTSKENLIQTALIISRKITTFSLLEEMTYIHGIFGYTIDELISWPDNKIISKCSDLLTFIDNHRKELDDYGVNSSLETKFRNYNDQFKMILETKLVNEETLLANTDQVSLLLNEINEIVELKLQNINNCTILG